jgi:hypothetical protein
VATMVAGRWVYEDKECGLLALASECERLD